MKKNIIIALICVFSALFCTAANAEVVNEPVLDIKTDILTVDGNLASKKSGRLVSILVTNPGVTKDNYTNADQDFLHKMTVLTGENGYYCFKIKINQDKINADGDIGIYVGGDEFTTAVSKTIYYARTQTRNDAIADLNGTVTGIKLKQYEKILSYISPVYNAVDKTKLATLIEGKNITLTIDNVAGVVYENAVIEAFNQGLAAVCIKADNLEFNDIIKLEELDTGYSCTAYKAYNEQVSAQGKKKILEGLLNKGYSTLDDLRKQFIKNTLSTGVSYGAKSGYSHVSELLTADNARAAGISIDGFLALDATKKAQASVIIMNGTHADEKALESNVIAAVLSAANSGNGGNPGGNGGSGGGGGGGGSAMSVPPIQSVPTQNENSGTNSIFNDISGFEWAEESIMSLYKQNILSGTGDRKFSPNSYITREQMAKLISLAFGYTKIGENSTDFSDVPVGAWYCEYVETVNENGIMLGKNEKLFGVGEAVTRQDATVILERALGMEKTDTSGNFTDFEEVPEYAKSAVVNLSKLGIITGFSDGSFRGHEPLTRAQAAVIIDRALKAR